MLSLIDVTQFDQTNAQELADHCHKLMTMEIANLDSEVEILELSKADLSIKKNQSQSKTSIS